MKQTSNDICCIWNSDDREAFAAAQRHKAFVKVACCIPWKGRPRDVVFYGRLRNVAGREATLVVQEAEVLSRGCKIHQYACEFFFCLARKNQSNGLERLGYRGSGRVLGVKKNARGEISHVSLRLASRCFVRRMRRDKRIDWTNQYCHASGALRVTYTPEFRCDLTSLLHRHSHEADVETRIVNISASGACAWMPEEPDLKCLSGEPDILCYMVPAASSSMDQPYVFLGKKMGFFRSELPNILAVRMHFVYELDWEKDPHRLSWIEISDCGSSRLREHLGQYDRDASNDTWFGI